MGEIGTLYVVATPIGNIEDLSPRARRILTDTPVLACEDTRNTGLLLQHLEIPRDNRRLVSYHDHNEQRQVAVLIGLLEDNIDVALVSDAGTPLISDPGYRIVSTARQCGIPVVPIPGPCAATVALSAAGLPTDRFRFSGFLPPKSGRRAKVIESISEQDGTVIFYVPARALEKTLGEIGAQHPDCTVVVARELTKIHEEFVSGTPLECLKAFEGRVVKGEVTLLVNVAVAAKSL